MKTKQKLKMGMIGGAHDAFIGAVHRIACRMDNEIELVAGAFSSDFSKTQTTGKSLGLNENRLYSTFTEMIEKESSLPLDEKIDFVSIVTPNHLHADPALLAMNKGFAIVLDKPLTHSLETAEQLFENWKKNPLPFAVTYTYAGYPMIVRARELIKNGFLGKLKKVFVEYHQGWLSTSLESLGNKQAAWRTDPQKSGKGGALGDIGSHAFHLSEFITHQKVCRLGSVLETKVYGRQLDDDGLVWLDFNDGLTGFITFSQIITGAENNVKLKVVGEKGYFYWEQEKCNSLFFFKADGSRQEFRAGTNYDVLENVKSICRTPGGHPEGYLEAFANEYTAFVHQYRAWKANDKNWKEVSPHLPTIEDGFRGVKFVELVFNQSKSDKKWADFN